MELKYINLISSLDQFLDELSSENFAMDKKIKVLKFRKEIAKIIEEHRLRLVIEESFQPFLGLMEFQCSRTLDQVIRGRQMPQAP